MGASLAIFGTGIWTDYLNVVRTGAGAGLVDGRNLGPAAQLAMLLSLGDGGARTIQVAVTVGALALTAWASWTRADPLEGIAWATAASLVTLPVTWYHYPAACIPLAIAALLRAHGTPAFALTVRSVAAAVVLAAVALLALPLLWIAVVLMVVAVRQSAAGTSGQPVPASGAA
jgi:hypothetical protein